MHRICFRYTKNRDEAEDLTQEVFLKVHGNYTSFEGNAQPSTWLYRVTVNHCLDYLRWRKRQGELMAAFADEMSDRPPQEAAADHPAKLLFRKLLEDLDEANRQVVMLRFEVGLTHEEIAEICGVSRVAITKRLAKFQARVQIPPVAGWASTWIAPLRGRKRRPARHGLQGCGNEPRATGPCRYPKIPSQGHGPPLPRTKRVRGNYPRKGGQSEGLFRRCRIP